MNGRALPGLSVARVRVHSLAHAVLGCTIAFVVFAAARPALADLLVPANSVVTLASGTLDLSCTDVVVAGTLRIASGTIANARHVTIQAGGTIDGGSGTVTLGGNWANSGQFVAGTGAVRFRDQCSLSAATVTGNTTFSTASFVSAVGKNYVFAVGTTQTINDRLDIAGNAPMPIQFRSSAPGQVANINLLPAGVQAIQHVGVTDVWATGQWLAPTLTNEGGGGNANRWFGGSASTPIPTLTDAMLLLLAALLAVTGALLSHRRRRDNPDFKQTHR